MVHRTKFYAESAHKFLQGKYTDLRPDSSQPFLSVCPSTQEWMDKLQEERITKEKQHRANLVKSAEILHEKANWRP